MRSEAKRVVATWLVVSVGLVGAVRAAVVLPEHCRRSSEAELDASVAAAVSWFETNQRPDGTWVYRYDTARGRDLGGYEWVRHAGVLLSLEQAAGSAAGVAADRAARIADRGWPAMSRKYVELQLDGVSLLGVSGTSSTTGGTALAGIALAERRRRTNDPGLDSTLLSLSRFVARQVQPDGSVLNRVDLKSGFGTPNSYSPFVAGQALFLLARARALTGTREFDGELRRILRYIATERAAREGYVPDVSDHWSAYGLAVLDASAPGLLTDGSTVAFVRKQIGIAGVQVRYESQRTNSHLNRWTRGRQTLGAGLGTLGEALGAWRPVVANQPLLSDHGPWIDERLVCVAGLLVDRQTDNSEAALVKGSDVARGAWTQFGITQMDDQQHALSALLAARNVDLDAPNAPRRSPVPEHAWLAVLLAVVLLNPARLVRRSASCASVPVTVVGTGLLGLIAAVGGPIVRTIDVSAATAGVGAGCAVVVASAAALLTRPARDGERAAGRLDLLLNGILRPETLLAAAAIGAGGWGWAWALTVAVVVTASTVVASTTTIHATILAWAARLFACGAIVLGIAFVVDCAYAV